MKFLAKSLPAFIGEGGISIETPMYHKPAERIKYGFRTTIQPDGDVINLLPQPDLFQNDSIWTKLYEESYRMHHPKVQKFLADLQSIHTIPWAISMFLSYSSVISVKKAFVADGTILIRYGEAMLWIVLIIPLQRYLSKYVFLKVIQCIMKRKK